MRLGYDLTIEQVQKLTMTPELIQAIQILLRERRDLGDRLLNAVEVVVKVALAGLAEQEQQLVGFKALVVADEHHAE